MKIFVPLEDAPPDAEMLVLVPYRCGLACEHALRETDGPDRGISSALTSSGSRRGPESAGTAPKP